MRCQLLRTDGELAPPYDTWQQVNVNGFGDPRNHNICGLGVFDGRIYAGTWNWSRGLQVWRGTPGEEVPFADWEKVADGGFGDRRNIMTAALLVTDDALYVGTIGTFNATGAIDSPDIKLNSAAGGALMMTRDGTTWENLDAPGFMDFPSIGVQWLEAFEGRVYVGGQAMDRPFQLWAYEPEPR